ncbi:hypothetical protein FRC08_005390 [Ceratobasidium sp. 394]|nr:hypothetical protein FRC08_005390 [Ceratobasidium sp. 394]
MVAVFLLTAAFAAANLAYLAFNPDSFAFEIAALALGSCSGRILNHAARTIMTRPQSFSDASSIVFGVGETFYYKINALELPIGRIMDALVPYTTPLGLETPARLTSRPVYWISAAFSGRAAPPSGAYNHTLPPLSFGYSFTPDVPSSLPIIRNDVCPSESSSSLNWVVSQCRASDAPLVAEELHTSDPELGLLSTQVGSLDDTCRSSQPFSGYSSAAARLDVHTVGFDTFPAKDHWAVYDPDHLPFGITEHASSYKLPLRPTGLGYTDNIPPPPGPHSTPASAGYLHETLTSFSPFSRRRVTPESSHMLSDTILRNNTCLPGDRPVADWAVCNRRDLEIDPFELPVYIYAPEILCPPQLARLDPTWAMLGLPDQCDHGSSFNWRIGVLIMVVLFSGARIYRYWFPTRPEKDESIPYTPSPAPTHWILCNEPIGNEEPQKSWATHVSPPLPTTSSPTSEQAQDDVSEIELELADDSEDSPDERVDPLNPAEIPLPDDGDEDLFSYSTTSGGEITASDSNMSLASSCGGISTCDNPLGAGADVSTDLDISSFTFSFTFDIRGRSWLFAHRLRRVAKGAIEESENVTLRPCKRRRLVGGAATAPDDLLSQDASARTSEVNHSAGAEDSESTDPILDAGHTDLQPTSSFGVDTPSQDDSPAHVHAKLTDHNAADDILTGDLKDPSSIPILKLLGINPVDARDEGHNRVELAGSSCHTTNENLGLPKPVAHEGTTMKAPGKKKLSTRKLVSRLKRLGIVPPDSSKLDRFGYVQLRWRAFPTPSLARRSRLYSIREEGDQEEKDEENLALSLSDLSSSLLDSDLDLDSSLGEDTPTKSSTPMESGSRRQSSQDYET